MIQVIVKEEEEFGVEAKCPGCEVPPPGRPRTCLPAGPGPAKFCQKVQRYLRSSHGNSKFPTLLRDTEQNAVNIIGSAIVDATEEENTEKQVKIFNIFCY